VCHFGIVEASGLKIMVLSLPSVLQWYDLRTEFHTNLIIGSKVDKGDGDKKMIS
jgi:hypothetical protein